MSDNERVVIFDTTLRDGEQSPGISLDVGEKLEIAEQLARLGVDYHRGRVPDREPGRLRGRRGHRHGRCKGPVITGLSRTGFKDVDRCWEAVRHAEKARIHVFIATSAIHMKKKLRMTEDQVKDRGRRGGRPGPGYTDDVEFSPEDGSRSDFDFMCEVLQIAVDNGATTLNIPDTVGFAVPEEYAELIPVDPGPGHGRLRRVDALPRRPGPGRGELAGRRSRPGPGRSSAPSTGSASGPATPPSRRS